MGHRWFGLTVPGQIRGGESLLQHHKREDGLWELQHPTARFGIIIARTLHAVGQRTATPQWTVERDGRSRTSGSFSERDRRLWRARAKPYSRRGGPIHNDDSRWLVLRYNPKRRLERVGQV